MQVVTTVGLDIAKSVFQVHGVDAAGQVVIRRQLKPALCRRVLPEVATVPGGQPPSHSPTRLRGTRPASVLKIPSGTI